MVDQAFQVQYFQCVQYEKMFFVAEHEHLEPMFVQIGTKVVFNGDGHHFMSKGKQLAKR